MESDEPASPFLSIPESEWVASNELAFAIRDAYPVSRGHTLVVTRRPAETWFDATPDEQAAVLELVHRVKAALDESHQPEGYNVGFNAGRVAGQTVMHLHVHVIPRYPGDMDDPRGGVRGVIPSKQKYGDDAETGGNYTGTGQVGEAQLRLFTSPLAELPRFVDGRTATMVTVLRRAMQHADEIDLVPAFVQPSGLGLIEADLEDALTRGARVRVLTGDYLGITSADALTRLLDLAGRHDPCQVRVHEVPPGGSFHPKAYLFARGPDGVAFIGSSNLTRTALTDGTEWNLRVVSSHDRPTFEAVRRGFEQLWTSEHVHDLSPAWIEHYRRRAPVPTAPEPEPREPPPTPHAIQRQALQALAATRAEGHTAGLVVMATGLGKTYLSAFDFAQAGDGEPRRRRALFVAHREEILDQARATWQRVLPGRHTGVWDGSRRETDADLVFASVQTLSRTANLRRFAPDHFDYVVIDEFHHAAAPSYRRLIHHFEPAFLLGLTATPDRLDGASLLELCGGNEVFRAGLLTAIRAELLVPFHYFGVRDELDFEPIPWRSGRFDPQALTHAVETEARAAQALRELRRHTDGPDRRALVFCVSTTHADFMARYLTEHGVPAAAVHSSPTSAPRAESLRRLTEGALQAVCAVDVFNEGVDLPAVDTVLMLRPTASPVIYLQQIGRGLRRAPDKTHLTIIDFIGNHRTFLQRPQALIYLTGLDVTVFEALRRLVEERYELPEGCDIEIETEALDLLQQLAGSPAGDTIRYEYESFRDTHGRRPTAVELLDVLGSFKQVNRLHSTYFDLVADRGDLTDDEARVLDRHRAWFTDLTKTSMSKSFKAVSALVLLDADRLTGEMSVEENARRSDRLLRRHPVLHRELTEGNAARRTFGRDFVRAWREMPLKVWSDAKGTTKRWFELDGDTFRSRLDVAPEDREAFDELTLELLELRLAEQSRKVRRTITHDPDERSYRLQVAHVGGRPRLRLDREAHTDLPPPGGLPVDIDGERLTLHVTDDAVTKATDGADPVDRLPALLRGWFGPRAGHPGTDDAVLLEHASGYWHLRPDTQLATADQGHTVPHLPFFPDLRVACGALRKTPRADQAKNRVPIRPPEGTNPTPTRHFLVKAEGDSMDGGDQPIADGDLVLCEWLDDPAEAAYAGKPCLLLRYHAGGDTTATIKIPRRTARGWTLESTHPDHPPIPIEPGARFEPIARVLQVARPTVDLVVGRTYKRQDIAEAFGREYNAWWRAGYRNLEVGDELHAVLLVTLNKGGEIRRAEHYADRWLSPTEFQWESQNHVDENHKLGRDVIHHERDGRTLHLFVRENSKVKGVSQPYVYRGPVRYLSHEGGKPMRVRLQIPRSSVPSRRSATT